MSFNKVQLGKDAKEAKKPISKQELKPIIPPFKKGGLTKKC
jgi:hypothetical protein